MKNDTSFYEKQAVVYEEKDVSVFHCFIIISLKGIIHGCSIYLYRRKLVMLFNCKFEMAKYSLIKYGCNDFAHILWFCAGKMFPLSVKSNN